MARAVVAESSKKESVQVFLQIREPKNSRAEDVYKFGTG
jgi:hypothetical protein